MTGYIVRRLLQLLPVLLLASLGIWGMIYAVPGNPVASIVGVTCHNAAAEQHMPTEGYWLIKAEDAAGATLVGFSSMSLMDTTAAPCDVAFGNVPNLLDNTNDFKSWPTAYSDEMPFPFPGM